MSTRDELLAEAGDGRYDAVIAAATFIPAETRFRLGGVRIGAGTGNMGSASWGGGSGEGGEAPLMNTPGINSRATAQMAMKALLKVRPDLPVDKLNILVAGGQFDTGKDLRHYPTEKLEGKRLAVIGYGNIGREFARLGQAFGMRVTIHARSRHHKWIEAEGFDYAETMEDAARGADALSVHLGLGPFDAGQQRYANAGLIGDEVLSLLNHGAVLINYDRGELVDVAALERALASGRVSHAAIDADLFKDGSRLSGPMLPYLRLVEAYGQRLELLPHAAADTLPCRRRQAGRRPDLRRHRRASRPQSERIAASGLSRHGSESAARHRRHYISAFGGAGRRSGHGRRPRAVERTHSRILGTRSGSARAGTTGADRFWRRSIRRGREPPLHAFAQAPSFGAVHFRIVLTPTM
ncbi:NAD(P)-dependent oxidoreductase [Mesorhizobium sp. CA6]|uniref:NAD(P)-dependent oxidoreductase n=1 Tax=Mesorhizobium sp. CA6 TaxID=588500 RepID=UPI00398CDE30